MKISVLLSLVLFSVSCNVVQMVTQGVTEVPEDFFQNNRGPENQYIFMSCNGTPCFFNTKDESVTIMDTGGSLLTPAEYYPYKGFIFFTAWDGSDQTYSYDLQTNNLNVFEGNAAKGFKEYNGDLFYLSGARQLRAITSPTGTSTVLMALNGTYATNYWLHADYGNNGTGNFYLCRDNSGSQLYKLNVSYSGGPTSATENLVQDSNPTNVPCSTDRPYGENGHLVYADGGLVYHYKIHTNYLYSFASNGSALSSIWYDNDGTFYYSETGNFDFLSYNVYNDTSGQTLLAADFQPNNFLKVINAPNSETFYFNVDSYGDDQLFKMQYVSGVPQHNQFSNLSPIGGNVLYYEIGSRGFYFLKPDGIYRMDFSRNIIKVYNGTISNEDFRSYSHDQVHNNN